MSVLGFAGHLLRNVTIHLIPDLLGSIGRVKRRMQEDMDNGPEILIDFFNENFVIFSDIHRGDGSDADRFKNGDIYSTALSYYNDKNYNLILLGDIEEGWGFKDKLDFLKQKNLPHLKLEMKFVNRGKYFRVIGNHDDIWRDQSKVDKYLFLINNFGQNSNKINPEVSIILKHEDKKILLIHGCQGHNFADIGDKCASDFINFKFKHGFKSSKDEFAKKRKKLRKQERKILKWAKDKNMIVVMGHTHIPYFMSIPSTRFEEKSLELIRDSMGKIRDSAQLKQLKILKDDQENILNSVKEQKKNIEEEKMKYSKVFFNTGNCCKDSDEISAIEISGGMIKEIYWKRGSTTPEINNHRDLDEVFSLIKDA